MSTPFQWDSRFETGVFEIDHQHRHLVEIINAFGERLMHAQGASWPELQAVIGEIGAYVREHFADEERLMNASEIHAAAKEEHARQHQHFTQEVARMIGSLAPEHPERSIRLFQHLVHWLVFHILGTDQAMVRQIDAIAAGASPEVAYERERASRRVDHSELLIESLRGLIEVISQQNRELAELNASLERKVAERTEELSRANEALEDLAMTDALTGLPNRRHALRRLGMLWRESLQDGKPLSAMMVDADGFKSINDSAGHDAGDTVLRALAHRLLDGVRTDDLVCRLGGDEFMVLCPNTSLRDALAVAEGLRRHVADLRIGAGGSVWSGRVSIGVAERANLESTEALLRAADEALYAAKRAGRNRVEAAPRRDAG